MSELAANLVSALGPAMHGKTGMQEAAAHARGVVTVEDGGRDEKRERAGEAGLGPATPAMATSSSAKRAIPQHFCQWLQVPNTSSFNISYYQIPTYLRYFHPNGLTMYHFLTPANPRRGRVVSPIF